MLRHYKALLDRRDYVYGGPNPWMIMARTWKMPIREIKRIISEERARRKNVQDSD